MHLARTFAWPVAVLTASLLPLGAMASAPDPVQVGRYSTVMPVARPAQADLLQAVVSLRFPEDVTTVGAALHHLLRRSGYRLAEPVDADPRTEILTGQPLPAVHRDLGPITLDRALTTLAGPAWRLVVDPVHRLVGFELAPGYVGLAAADEGTEEDAAEDTDCGGESWTWG